MTWTLSCARCGQPDAYCACEVDEYTREQQRRLREGLQRLSAMSPADKEQGQLEALANATDLPDSAYSPPSYTRWHRDVENERMMDNL